MGTYYFYKLGRFFVVVFCFCFFNIMGRFFNYKVGISYKMCNLLQNGYFLQNVSFITKWVLLTKCVVYYKMATSYKMNRFYYKMATSYKMNRFYYKMATSYKMCRYDTGLNMAALRTSNYNIECRKEGNLLFNDALNTLYGVRHMVKYHSDSERGNPLPPHGLLFPINSKGSFICTIPQT